MSVSVTTRPQRAGEVDGRRLSFRQRERFDAMVDGGELLEHAVVFGHYYGTPRAPVDAALAAGRDVLFDIDWQGTQQLREQARDDLVSVFVLPPVMDELERRLRARAQDSRRRGAPRAWPRPTDEISHWAEYDYVVVNQPTSRRASGACRRSSPPSASSGTARSGWRISSTGCGAGAEARGRPGPARRTLDAQLLGARRRRRSGRREQRFRIRAERFQALAQHLAALAEGRRQSRARDRRAGTGRAARHAASAAARSTSPWAAARTPSRGMSNSARTSQSHCVMTESRP